MTNKEIVLKFYEQVFNSWDLTNLEDMMREDYIQHSPEVVDGRDGLFFGIMLYRQRRDDPKKPKEELQ